LARATAVQLSLNIRFRYFDSGGTTVDHHADAATMRFSKGGDAEELAECVAHRAEKLNRYLAITMRNLIHTWL